MTIRNTFALVAMLGAFALVGQAQIKHIVRFRQA